MNAIRTIRARLGLTQRGLADLLGISQGNVSLYEHGQVMPPHVAGRLIDLAAQRGVEISFNDIYERSCSSASSVA